MRGHGGGIYVRLLDVDFCGSCAHLDSWRTLRLKITRELLIFCLPTVTLVFQFNGKNLWINGSRKSFYIIFWCIFIQIVQDTMRIKPECSFWQGLNYFWVTHVSMNCMTSFKSLTYFIFHIAYDTLHLEIRTASPKMSFYSLFGRRKQVSVASKWICLILPQE